ncbi:MAG: GIY-YIG nuclease family protein [Kiritimatiellia bacterium]|nr:GIY-YIG nuclease family protein [Kiritimatiellia bacterium]
MKERFREMIAEVERRYDALVNASPFKCVKAPISLARKPGIYLFSESGKPLYIGRTDDLRKRLANHRHRSHNTATFAFLLARHETGKRAAAASYQASGSRADLFKNDPTFSVAFNRAIERIAEMDVRVVEESDPVRQALLEIYAAFVTGAKYNDFENH